MQPVIDDLPEQIALLDDDFNILATNRAWTVAVEQAGYQGLAPGGNYYDFCASPEPKSKLAKRKVLAALDEIACRKSDYSDFTYQGEDRWAGREFHLCLHRIWVNGAFLITVTRSDLTELHELRKSHDSMKHSLEQSQTTERQRLARELHDSTSQSLASIGLLLGCLKQDPATRPGISPLVDEIQELLGDVHREIRTMSFLAYPPLLEKAGFRSALLSLAQGFTRRAQLKFSFETEGDLSRIPHETEAALYRVAQEALSNIHRHAGAKGIGLVVRVRASAVHMVIADDGVGLSPDVIGNPGRSGVGLASMHERMSEVGGR
ncbi:MAG: sensor histidine kinase, partial [Sphingomicrobium sp.]